MRRADALWHYNPIALQFLDVTSSLGSGGVPVSIGQNEKLYVGCSDWMSGLILIISQAPAAVPMIAVEMFDGSTNAWQPIPLQERTDQLAIGHSLSSQGYDFRASGMAYWGRSQWAWVPKASQRGFPENPDPPVESSDEMYWVRLRNLGSTPLTIDRVLPVMYNTYATVDSVAEFMGMSRPFDDVTAPTRTFIRHRIRAAEDWLDTYTRRTWRMRLQLNERPTFNPHGIKLRHVPVWFVTRFAVWAANTLQVMVEGRNQDYYVSTDTGMLYFTRVVFGRGLNWTTVSPRFMRQTQSVEVDYVYGLDFDLAEDREIVTDVVCKHVGHALVMQGDWTSWLISNPDAVPKADKAKEWKESAEEQATLFRAMLTA